MPTRSQDPCTGIRFKTVSPEIMPPTLRSQDGFTDSSPKLMPPKLRQNGCRRVSLPRSFSEKRLNHWHDIHDLVLTWCPCAGSISWRQGKRPKGLVSKIQQFLVDKQTFTRFLPAKRFADSFFMYSICQSYLVLVQFG